MVPTSENSSVYICYDDKTFDNTKTINPLLKVESSNSEVDFLNYLNESDSERLILRFQDLIKFVVAGKTERLAELQSIIGFDDVREMRSLLKKLAGESDRELKRADFDGKKNFHQAILIDSFGNNIVSIEKFFESVNQLLVPLKPRKEISSFEDAREVLKSLESEEDSSDIERIRFFSKIEETLKEIESEIVKIEKEFSTYSVAYKKLLENSEKLRDLQLVKLLKEGKSVLEKEIFAKNLCPLCEQGVDTIQLLTEINRRIDDLDEVTKEQRKLEETAGNLRALVSSSDATLNALISDTLFESEENKAVLDDITKLKNSIGEYSLELRKNILSSEELRDSKTLAITNSQTQALIANAAAQSKQILETRKGNSKIEIAVKLAKAIDAYSNHLRLDKREEILTKQKSTFDALYSDFVKRQENALDAFLTMFSTEINKYYAIMNPGERVEDIRLVPIKDKTGEELDGITIEFDFFGTARKPPTAFLSESHINCLGIAFFLSSVKAFNKANKFFLLDDVISSFDSNHRIRFIRLLLNEFSDYQVLLLTHEDVFFQYAVAEVKSKNWGVYKLNWSDSECTYLDGSPVDLRSIIEAKLLARNADGLGNDIRKYGEHELKKIAFDTDVKMSFRFNNQNEDRMLHELLTSIQGTINKHSPSDLKGSNNINEILASPLLIANKGSHDSWLTAKIGDLEVFWEDLNKLLSSLNCREVGCETGISQKYYDTAKKQIRCKCGKLSYDWSK